MNDDDDDFRQDFPRLNNLKIDEFTYYTTDKFNKCIIIDPALDLAALHINVRGLECNYDNFMMYLNSLSLTFDIMVLSECHISNTGNYGNIDSRLEIQGYNKFYSKSEIKFGGVVMYIKKDFNVTVISELTACTDFYDSLYIKICCSRLQKPIVVGGYYRHCRNNSHDIIRFCNALDEHLSHKSISKFNKVIAGDFNICLLKSAHNLDSLTYLNTLLQNGLETHTFLPTRFTHYKDSLQIKSATLIDQIHSDLYAFECISGNLFYPDSDHYANFTVFKDIFKKSSKVQPEQYRRDFKNCDPDSLLHDYNCTDWDELVHNVDNLETASENIINRLEQLYDKHVPLVKLSHRKAKYREKPWIKGQLLLDIRAKNGLHVTKCNTPSANNDENFRVSRNYVTSRLRSSKKIYLKDYFNKFRHNTKKMWQGINMALEQSKRKKEFPSQVKDVTGKDLKDPQTIAHAFANYFENIPLKTRAKISRPNDRHFLDYLHKMKPVDNYLVLFDTNPYEIIKLINGLNDNSSPGPLNIPNKFLKLLAQPLSILLSVIVNRSLRTGYVPLCFKIGKQTPVFKSGVVQIQNFRPITVANSLSKILEKVVRSRVNKFLDDNKILNNRQFGFRKKHSTSHAIINLLETSLEGLDLKLKTGGVFLDISKAFDCVPHNILLRKLEFYGFRDRSLMWFESYLKNRSQYVEIKGKKSARYSPTLGVPQGGVLAPILFIMFVNDIIQSSSTLEFSIHADDTCLILSIDRKCYDETMARELSKVMNWFSCNELLLNISKTDYLNFGPHYPKQYIKGEYDLKELHDTVPLFLVNNDYWDIDGPCHKEVNKKGEFLLHELHHVMPDYMINEHIYTDNGQAIADNEFVKYLGVFIDNKLEFQYHLSTLCCKLNRMVGTFWKCPDIGLDTKKVIYFSLVESHLSYGILAWGSNFSRKIYGDFSSTYIPPNLKPIKKVQNKIIRAIFRKPKLDKRSQTYTDMSALYKELGVLKIFDLYCYNLAILCFDFHHNIDLPDTIKSLFTLKSDVTDRSTRQHYLNLYPKQVNLNSTMRKPSHAGSLVWNALHDDIKDIDKKRKFKATLKNFYIDKY